MGLLDPGLTFTSSRKQGKVQLMRRLMHPLQHAAVKSCWASHFGRLQPAITFTADLPSKLWTYWVSWREGQRLQKLQKHLLPALCLYLDFSPKMSGKGAQNYQGTGRSSQPGRKHFSPVFESPCRKADVKAGGGQNAEAT